MKKTYLVILMLIAISDIKALLAETAYISDRLYLGLYNTPDVNAEPVRTLINGTQVDILQRQGAFVFLQLEDGTQGWARAEFVTTQLPARLQMEKLKAEIATLKSSQETNAADTQQLETVQNRLINANKTIGRLRNELKAEKDKAGQVLADSKAQQLSEQESIDKLNRQLQESEQRAESRQQEIAALKERISAYKTNDKMLLKILWLGIAMLISMAIGAALGVRWLSVRIRSRFNGLKVW